MKSRRPWTNDRRTWITDRGPWRVGKNVCLAGESPGSLKILSCRHREHQTSARRSGQWAQLNNHIEAGVLQSLAGSRTNQAPSGTGQGALGPLGRNAGRWSPPLRGRHRANDLSAAKWASRRPPTRQLKVPSLCKQNPEKDRTNMYIAPLSRHVCS